MRILFAAAEADPFIKVGGLGDVAGSLPQAIQQYAARSNDLNLDIRLVIPFHNGIPFQKFGFQSMGEFQVVSGQKSIRAQAFQTDYSGLKVYLIGGEPVASSSQVYSMNAALDGEKFTFFSLAVLELIRFLDWQPDILHVNDWHTAIAAYALALRRPQDPLFQPIQSV